MRKEEKCSKEKNDEKVAVFVRIVHVNSVHVAYGTRTVQYTSKRRHDGRRRVPEKVEAPRRT
jgi:hypothetical protein